MILFKEITQHASANFHILLYLIVGGVKLQILEKNPQVHLIIIRKWPKNNPLFYEILIISPPPWSILFATPTFTSRQKRVDDLRKTAQANFVTRKHIKMNLNNYIYNFWATVFLLCAFCNTEKIPLCKTKHLMDDSIEMH